MDGFTIKDVQKYAWDYFQLHSNQRMTAFNYFIALSALVATGLGATLQQNGTRFCVMGISLGGLLMVISFVFWKIDQRTRRLIKNAEKALMHAESDFPCFVKTQETHCTQLFTYEGLTTQALQERTKFKLLRAPLSYTQSFNIIFSAFALCGLGGLVYSTIILLKR